MNQLHLFDPRMLLVVVITVLAFSFEILYIFIVPEKRKLYSISFHVFGSHLIMILIGMALASNITGTAMIFNDKITFWALMAIGIILYYSGLVKFLLNEQPKKELPIIVHVGHKLGKRRASRFQ